MKRIAAVAVVLALILAAVWWQRRGGDGDPAGEGPAPSPEQPEPPDQTRLSSEQQSELLQNLRIDAENDPIGSLRLEGQVLDELEHGVGGATVWLSSNPPRTSTTEEDGTFVFDKLIARTYYLRARADELVGGPVQVDLTDTTDPIVIRVQQGAALEVTVVDRQQTPIAGAAVQLRPEDMTETTGADGVAEFRGVGRGSRVVHASAAGYAAADQLVQIAETADRAAAQVVLRRGAPVAGRVIGEDGKPIAGARVVARDASALFSLARASDGAVTGDDGAFRLGAVAAGAYRFVATHDDYAPGSSEPIQLDGTTEKTGVVIELETGLVVAGRVVTADGQPGKWATVRVGPSRWSGFTGFEGVRQVIAEEDGSFELDGLKPTQVVVVASGDETSSETVELDLAATGDVRDLVLKLDVDGVIAGTVVDEQGEPIAEAQVTAWPDFLAGQSISDWGVRGSGAAATDGGGRFEFHGMPDGKYRLRAARGALDENAMLDRGVQAQPGDTDVRIVLARPGGLAGRVKFASGGVPEAFTVSVGPRTPHPVSDPKGKFRLDGLPAGKHDVMVRGPQFSEKILRDVEIAGGATNDLGTIEVERGRSASGRVLDAAGKPVAGAEVVHARQQLLSDGKKLGGSLGSAFDERLGLKRATTDERGAYRINGIGQRRSVIAAEHAELGRSLPVDLPPGAADVPLDLVLQPFGALQGKVTAGGKPVGSASVLASPTAAASPIVVQVGGGGSYVIEKLAAGDYQVTAMIQAAGGLGATSASRTVTVAPNETTELDINVVVGDVTLEVRVEPLPGHDIDAAQVFLFEGKVNIKTGRQLNQRYMGGGGEANQRMSFQMGDKPAVIPQLTAGPYSVCVIPITGDMSDPTFMQRIQRHVDTLPVHCRQTAVAESPKTQSFTMKTPGMPPLPEDDG